MPAPIDVGAALGSLPPAGGGDMGPDLSALDAPAPAPGEETAEGDMGEESDVDPDFLAAASDIFPDWGPDDPRFKQLQDLIDMRVSGA